VLALGYQLYNTWVSEGIVEEKIESQTEE